MRGHADVAASVTSFLAVTSVVKEAACFTSQQEGEEAWVMLGRTGVLGPTASGVAAGSSAYDEWAEDVSPRALADADSQFVECGSLSVHVKEAAPPVCTSMGLFHHTPLLLTLR